MAAAADRVAVAAGAVDGLEMFQGVCRLAEGAVDFQQNPTRMAETSSSQRDVLAQINRPSQKTLKSKLVCWLQPLVLVGLVTQVAKLLVAPVERGK